ncbi:MAG: DEAD/DEAH box helicase [Clostridium sp.]
MNFKDLGISEERVLVLKRNGITTPTEIQEECIVDIKNGRDIIGEASTGTGKTLAFLLPLMERTSSREKGVQCLILSPTRELAIQITEECEKLNYDESLKILSMYGGKDIGSQMKKLNGDPQIVIATPGRLLDHIKRRTINLKNLKTLVIDEADQMLLMGFRNEIDTIMKEVPKKCQVLCFSATMDAPVKKLAYRYMNDPRVVSVKKEETNFDVIRQQVVETIDRLKREALFEVLEDDNPFMAIIFCRTKRRADELEEAMKVRKYDCKVIHSDIPQNKRERILKNFRDGELQYLIATDVASRGLDIGGVDHIYNFDIPEKAESYIHRIGRTGRAGESGYTCLFVDPKDMRTLEEIERKIGRKIERRVIRE